MNPFDKQAIKKLILNRDDEGMNQLTQSIQHSSTAVHNFVSIVHEISAEPGLTSHVNTQNSEVIKRIDESLNEMHSMLEGSTRLESTILSLTNYGDGYEIKISWQDSRVGKVLWDVFDEYLTNPIIVFSCVSVLFDRNEYSSERRPAPPVMPILYRYHPERFKTSRDYHSQISSYFRHNVNLDTGMLSIEQLNDITRFVAMECNQKTMSYPRRYKDNTPNPTFIIDAEINLSTAYGRFAQAGRQILDFPDSLVELLSQTDIEDIPLSQIKMPYASQYLHFRTDIEIAPGWKVDGCYVEQRGDDGDIRFTVTGIPTDQGNDKLWYVYPEVQYTQDFVGEFRDMSLSDAVQRVLEYDLDSFKENQNRERNKDEQNLLNNLNIDDRSQENALIREGETIARHDAYRFMLNLAVNALCYVTAYPDDISTEWPDGTPSVLLRKTEDGSFKQKRRAQSKLSSLGYVPVHICGKNLSKQMTSAGISLDNRDPIATHWRRGHWRNQPYGPKRSLRKLIWLMPTLINAQHQDEPDEGHIYHVES